MVLDEAPKNERKKFSFIVKEGCLETTKEYSQRGRQSYRKDELKLTKIVGCRLTESEYSTFVNKINKSKVSKVLREIVNNYSGGQL